MKVKKIRNEDFNSSTSTKYENSKYKKNEELPLYLYF